MSRKIISPNSIASSSDLDGQNQIARLEQKIRARKQNKKLQTRGKSIDAQSLINELQDHSQQFYSIISSFARIISGAQSNLASIDNICISNQINFLIEIRPKMMDDEFKSFLRELELYKISQGGRLQEEGKLHPYHYIILQGNFVAIREQKHNEEQKQYRQTFQYSIGQAIFSNTMITHKSNPYTVKAKSSGLLLRFSDECYNKYLKRICTKEFDQLARSLAQSILFRGISELQIKKYIPYFPYRRFKYNEIVYEEGDLIKHLYMIIEGEAQINYEKNKRVNKVIKKTKNSFSSPNIYRINYIPDKRQIKVVKVGKKELFGLEAPNVFEQNYYNHHVRTSSNVLKTLMIGLDILYEIQLDNPILEDNIHTYVRKVQQIHADLLQKYANITDNPQENIEKKKKKKRKNKKKKKQINFQWWGLAQKMTNSKKYRIPPPPINLKSDQGPLRLKAALNIQNRVTKLQNFKRRLFEQQIESIERLQRQQAEKQNSQACIPLALIPRLHKIKIKAIQAKPTTVNSVQKVKLKLLEYAKNGEIYVDRLQLQ